MQSKLFQWLKKKKKIVSLFISNANFPFLDRKMYLLCPFYNASL